MGNIEKISFSNAIRTKPKPIEFIINGLKAGTVGSIVGAGSTGKSYFALQLSVSVACNNIIFLSSVDDESGFEFKTDIEIPNSRKVGYISAEDTRDVIENRIYSFGQYYKSIYSKYFKKVEENLEILSLYGTGINLLGKMENKPNNWNKQWIDFLMEFCKEKSLVILDTFTRLHTADENSNGQMSELLKIFEEIAEKTQCAIVFIHHTNKSSSMSGQADQQGAIRGASALTDNARFQINLTKMDKGQAKSFGISEDNRQNYLSCDFTKINYSKPIPKIWLKREDGGILTYTDVKEQREQDTQDEYSEEEPPKKKKARSALDLI